ncbi:MalY/PatB family protein [Lacticaseibacillus thailandensis]|uniref:cysteine-S-conjugate beta-lyase n=1 Tax=Lacticaseibacillus thailandensis DSM 22698 = JCM 13996 TaxID=1423810 RepID=A0A0R2C8U7_9LACO|nr:PatB family C-S lyase [Lacticaseibacillus thailandensis]KRM87733.1 maly [Lacticaseibacillus thailandensis DSM 22698 = JCM 13996]
MAVQLPVAVKAFVDANLVDRRGTNSEKWDGLQGEFGATDLLPLWIADMEFKAPQAVRDALTARVANGVYGYSFTPDSYYAALADWMQRRHGVTIQRDWVRLTTGIVKALYMMVDWLTAPGAPVVVMEPVYYPFMHAIEDQGRKVVSADLQRTATGWQIDFDRLEQVFAQQHPRLLILCSPHNPVGRIWTADELRRVLTLAEQYHVIVVADEIHQDFEVTGPQFTSALAVATPSQLQHLIVLNAASKTFNLAALNNGHVLIPDATLRADYDQYAQRVDNVAGTMLGQVAAEAGYRQGEAWFDDLLAVIRFNYAHLQAVLAAGAPDVRVDDLQGTYLSFVDLGAYVDAAHLHDFVQQQAHLAVDYGEWFAPITATYIRLNLATDPQIVDEAAQRIVRAVRAQ